MMSDTTDPSRKRSRRFVVAFVVVKLSLLALALYVNFANPFHLGLKPQETEAAVSVFEPLVIATAAGPKSLRIEVADDPLEMQKGLMFRQSMPADQGMLFVHEADGERMMWMKNTYLSLDMLFIEANGRIHRIAERTQPFSEDTVASQGPVRAVLELNAGQAAAMGIKVGDMVKQRAFGNAP
jgi:uncharacterized protein